LCGLIATEQQENHLMTTLREVHPIARASMDTHFMNTTTNRLTIAKVTVLCCVQSGDDTSLADVVT